MKLKQTSITIAITLNEDEIAALSKLTTSLLSKPTEDNTVFKIINFNEDNPIISQTEKLRASSVISKLCALVRKLNSTVE